MPFRYDFTRLTTRDQLVARLGLTQELFDFVIDFQPPPEPPPVKEPGPAGDPNARIVIEAIEIPAFFRHRIPKRNKVRGYRTVWETLLFKNEYKALGRWLSGYLEYKLSSFPHPAAFGYLGGRNIKDNAAAHCGHERLLVIDILDFFPSITAVRIEALFVETGMTPEVASALSSFVTIDGVLPIGLSTSPVLSNAIFLPTDIQLQELAHASGATYTRYSDDLSFSGDGDLPNLDTIGSILAAAGFVVAASKTRRSRRGQAHFVTGLSISETDRPHVPRKKKTRLRQELYYSQKFGLGDHLARKGVTDANVTQQEINRLDGLVKFVAYHEPRLSGRIKPQWSEILQRADKRPSYTPRRQDRMPFCICIDEAEFQSPTGPMLALGLSVSQHQDRLITAAQDVLADSLADPWAAGNRDVAVRRGLHFVDVTEDLRLRYVERLQTLPFEGYVAMARLERPDTYEATYLRLLGAVIKRRLMAAESRLVFFVIEQNEKVSEIKVRNLIASAQEELKAENNRRPRSTAVEFVGKPSPAISAPDFLLGVLGKYLGSQEVAAGRPVPRDKLMFERLREKFRLILDVDGWTEYSRRRPIQPW
ncbi:MAG TPA: reverse transcriptase family protein [Caulobacteraceae bacterium]|jgi:hypothetical protein|nr:reverse transcriptase family protein [Caulobacteraceae bacterium]